MWFLIWLACMFIGAMLLADYNRAGTGFLLGLILGPLGVIIALALRITATGNERRIQHRETLAAMAQPAPAQLRHERDCPFCAEPILAKAIVCKHCGRDVEPVAETPTRKPRVLVAPSPPPPQPTTGTMYGAGRWVGRTIGQPRTLALIGALLFLWIIVATVINRME